MFNTLDNSSDNLVFLLEFNITDDYQKFDQYKGTKVHELVVPF
jgi:hypothetical protein